MTSYTRDVLERLHEVSDHLSNVEDILDHTKKPPALSTYQYELEELAEKIEIEINEYHFHLALTEELEKEDGLQLIDDGTMDTVLQCPICNGWLRFDGRESGIMHMENDDECWLCGTFDDDKGA